MAIDDDKMTREASASVRPCRPRHRVSRSRSYGGRIYHSRGPDEVFRGGANRDVYGCGGGGWRLRRRFSGQSWGDDKEGRKRQPERGGRTRDDTGRGGGLHLIVFSRSEKFYRSVKGWNAGPSSPPPLPPTDMMGHVQLVFDTCNLSSVGRYPPPPRPRVSANED